MSSAARPSFRRGRLQDPRIWLLAALLGLLGGCADETLRPAELVVDVGDGFRISIADGQRLVIRSADGRLLLDSLGPGPVPADGPPLAGFAVRDVALRYEMKFGSFRPDHQPAGPWRVARWLRAVDLAGEGGPGEESGGVGLTATEADGAVLAQLELTEPEPGHLVVRVRPGAGPERRFSWGFACSPADHFAGLGAQTWDADHRGETVPCLVQENGIGKVADDAYDTGDWMVVGRRHSSHAPIPQYLSRRGYVLTVDSDRPTTFAFCSESEHAARIELSAPAEIHLFDGPSPAEALERSSAAFGRPRLPPRVAFAPWLDAIGGSDNVRRVAAKLRAEAIPASVIWTEDWRGGEWKEDRYELLEEWEVDRSLYPDIELLAADLQTQGFHFHVYFNPFVYEGTKAWQQTQPNGWLVQCPAADGSGLTDCIFTGAKFEPTGLVDLDNPEARAWAVSKMQAALALGADGWMNDYAEWLPTEAVTAVGSGLERHNVYPVQWQQVAREAIDTAPGSGERLFFGRSGWLGTPELADVIWAADQRTSFDADDGLPTVVPIGIGLGVAGVSTYGHDIGGYQSATNEGATKELFYRWTELGAWSPVMRTHHGAQPEGNVIWEHDEETIAHFRRYAARHVSLLPLFEALALQAAQTGLPIWRGLALEFPDDPEVWPLVDQVLVGDGLLLAPVLEEGVTSRAVYLPAGTWYPFGGGRPLQGPRWVEADAPVEEIPVFARGGTIVPTLPEGVMTLVHESAAVPGPAAVGDDRIVHAFVGRDGFFAEIDGLRYELDSPRGEGSAAPDPETVVARYRGEPLGECAAPLAPPCAEAARRGLLARLQGPGDLEIETPAGMLATVRIRGGSPLRQLTVDLRW